MWKGLDWTVHSHQQWLWGYVFGLVCFSVCQKDYGKKLLARFSGNLVETWAKKKTLLDSGFIGEPVHLSHHQVWLSEHKYTHIKLIIILDHIHIHIVSIWDINWKMIELYASQEHTVILTVKFVLADLHIIEA